MDSVNLDVQLGPPNLTCPFGGEKENAIETFQAKSLHDGSVLANDPARQPANACAKEKMTIQEATFFKKCMLRFKLFLDEPSSSKAC